MPISDIQNQVLKLIATNRSPQSYLAGATVIHRKVDTPRFSQDLDFFHDIENSVAQCAEKDAATLQNSGYNFSWIMRTPSFYRAVVVVDDKPLKIEWAQDSVYRFFPIQKDELCGYRLHDVDAATNKMLALAGREKIRDFVDIMYLHENYLSLGTMAWAACGKDPGFTPEFLLNQISRHVAYSQNDLNNLNLTTPLDIKTLKQKWLTALSEAEKLIVELPGNEIGCLYLSAQKSPVTPNPGLSDFNELIRHHGSISGAWPVLSPYLP